MSHTNIEGEFKGKKKKKKLPPLFIYRAINLKKIVFREFFVFKIIINTKFSVQDRFKVTNSNIRAYCLLLSFFFFQNESISTELKKQNQQQDVSNKKQQAAACS
jgi:hypothetical protein